MVNSISENEIETAKYFKYTFTVKIIDKIASVYTEGYRLGLYKYRERIYLLKVL